MTTSKDDNVTVIPAAPGYFLIRYDMEFDVVDKTPIVAWRVECVGESTWVVPVTCDIGDTHDAKYLGAVQDPQGNVYDMNATYKRLPDYVTAEKERQALEIKTKEEAKRK